MREDQPSRTAIGVALRRAAHQIIDQPRIFEDPLALPILGPLAARVPSQGSLLENPALRALRLFLAVRSRFAEDELAAAFARGTRQYVLLGAGLDTFAYRNPHQGLRVFEVDHPATQRWKRARLESAGIAIPSETVFVPVDFEREKLPDALCAAGFRDDERAFFAWLGVVPYLTEEAFDATLGFIANTPAESGVVFDYGADAATLGFRERLGRRALASRVAAAGEPFRLFFNPEVLRAKLAKAGFRHIDDLGAAEINARYSLQGRNRLAGRGARLISARL